MFEYCYGSHVRQYHEEEVALLHTGTQSTSLTRNTQVVKNGQKVRQPNPKLDFYLGKSEQVSAYTSLWPCMPTCAQVLSTLKKVSTGVASTPAPQVRTRAVYMHACIADVVVSGEVGSERTSPHIQVSRRGHAVLYRGLRAPLLFLR